MRQPPLYPPSSTLQYRGTKGNLESVKSSGNNTYINATAYANKNRVTAAVKVHSPWIKDPTVLTRRTESMEERERKKLRKGVKYLPVSVEISMKRYGRHVSRIREMKAEDGSTPLTFTYPSMGNTVHGMASIRGQTRRQRASNGVFKRSSRNLESSFRIYVSSSKEKFYSIFYLYAFLYGRSKFFLVFFSRDYHSQECLVRFVSGRTVRRWRDSICKSRG